MFANSFPRFNQVSSPVHTTQLKNTSEKTRLLPLVSPLLLLTLRVKKRLCKLPDSGTWCHLNLQRGRRYSRAGKNSQNFPSPETLCKTIRSAVWWKGMQTQGCPCTASQPLDTFVCHFPIDYSGLDHHSHLNWRSTKLNVAFLLSSAERGRKSIKRKLLNALEKFIMFCFNYILLPCKKLFFISSRQKTVLLTT